jgi:hypothetical protein
MLVEALKQTSREATILLYSPALDPHLQKMTEPADGCVLIPRNAKSKKTGKRLIRKRDM